MCGFLPCKHALKLISTVEECGPDPANVRTLLDLCRECLDQEYDAVLFGFVWDALSHYRPIVMYDRDLERRGANLMGLLTMLTEASLLIGHIKSLRKDRPEFRPGVWGEILSRIQYQPPTTWERLLDEYE